jgi:hypothetical protein
MLRCERPIAEHNIPWPCATLQADSAANFQSFFGYFSTIKTDVSTILRISSKLQLVIVDVFFNYRGKRQAIAGVCMSTQRVENILDILSHIMASNIAKHHTVAI